MDMTLLNFITTVGATVVGAFLIAVGAAFWRLSGDVKLMRQLMEGMTRDWERRFSELSKDVELLKAMLEQGRTWRWGAASHALDKEHQ